jgi:hypothetical protein
MRDTAPGYVDENFLDDDGGGYWPMTRGHHTPLCRPDDPGEDEPVREPVRTPQPRPRPQRKPKPVTVPAPVER